MSKVSILIPSRNEVYEIAPGVTVLQRMVQDIYQKATGEFEVIVAFDGPPYQGLPDYPNLTRLECEQQGLKPCVNAAASVATGKYMYKSDSNCMFGPSFDEILQENMEDNWLVTPRFYVLDAEKWAWQDERFYDYFFLHCPLTDEKQFRFKAGGHDRRRTLERLNTGPLAETMQLHGSGWFLTRDYFRNCLGGMSSVGYDTFGMEPPELGLKTWLGPWGGKVMVNKSTWYAHMHKGGQRPRGYPLSGDRIWNSYDYAAKYWMGNSWAERAHDLEWLVEKFMPVPTWPEDWRERWTEWKKSQ